MPRGSPTVCRLEADGGGDGRRLAHGPTGVRPQRAERRTQCDRHAPARARAARVVPEVPRVAGGRDVLAARELVRDLLADDDGARLAEPPHHRRVVRRGEAGQEARACLRGRVARRQHVLDPDGDPVERTAGHFCVRASRCGQRLLGRHMDVGVHHRLGLVDPAQRRLDQLDRRQLALPHEARGLADRHGAEVSHASADRA